MSNCLLELNKIYCENCLVTMSKMQDNFVDLVVTSPPYDNLREYNGYVFDFESIARELYRIIKIGGVLVWVIGDATIKGSETGTSFKHALYFKDVCGFNLHDTMIYEKSGSIPSSNRYTQIFEYMFILSKGKPLHLNLIRDKENKWAGSKTFGRTSFRKKDGSIVVKSGKRIISDIGMRTNIWRYANGYGFGQKNKIAYEHPATFPEQLAKDHILSWSNEGDLIYDPMCGSGTTLQMAKECNRDFIGSDISKEYCKLANRRVFNE